MVYILSAGDFSNLDNLVVKNESVRVSPGSSISMFAGNDTLSGSASGSGDQAGLWLQYSMPNGASTLSGASGNDLVQGAATATGVTGIAYGIRIGESSLLDTGTDNDVVTGFGEATALTGTASAYGVNLLASATLRTDTIPEAWELGGIGNDVVTGEARSSSATSANVVGIAMAASATIETGAGNDVITGNAIAAAGATGSVFGIRGNGTSSIFTGSGNDVVRATASINGTRTNGFGSTGTGLFIVDLGSGNDVVKGFGKVTLKGGTGYDVYDLSEYSVAEFDFTGFTAGNGVTIQDASNPLIKAVTTGFEAFIFRDAVLPYAALQFA